LVEITNCNQLPLHPYGIVIIDNEKKRSCKALKMIEICSADIDDKDTGINEIVITSSECKNKASNTNKSSQLLDISTELKKFITKDKE
jgi:hypothetical protein